jgi:hypothetical protein
MFNQLRPLTMEERHQCWERARDLVSGPRPVLSNYRHSSIAKYPAWLTMVIFVLCLILLVAAFIPSAIRLYDIGSRSFSSSITDIPSKSWAGTAIIFMAEIGQVVFTLARSVLARDSSKSDHYLLLFGSVASTFIALVGNTEQSAPWTQASAFAWLEAIIPPLLVLSTSNVLKSQVLDAVRQRHDDQKNYQMAVQAWSLAYNDPEKNNQWLRHYYGSLREAIFVSNNRLKIGKEILPTLTGGDWASLVRRELNFDNWYEEVASQVITIEKPVETSVPVSNSLGSEEQLELQSSSQKFTATCPHCGRVLGTEYLSYRAMINAISSHSRSCDKKVRDNEGVSDQIS